MTNWQEYWLNHQRSLSVTTNARPNLYTYDGLIKDIESSIGLNSSDIVLDSGCGTGELSKQIRPKVKMVYAMDYSISMVDLAEQNLGVEIPVVWSDVRQQLPFNNNKFSKTLCVAVMQYIGYNDKQTMVQELMRVTVPGGYVFIGDILPPENKWKDDIYSYNLGDFQSLYKQAISIPSSYEPEQGRFHIIIKK